jgi:hypothetical protein
MLGKAAEIIAKGFVLPLGEILLILFIVVMTQALLMVLLADASISKFDVAGYVEMR